MWGATRSLYPSKEVEVKPNTVVEARIIGVLWALLCDILAFDAMTQVWIPETYNPLRVAWQLGCWGNL